MTTVSITLATYNGSRFLGQQLQTLASQERLPDELVVSDDASIGGTVAKIEAFAATAPFPVRRQRNAKRLGYRANLIRAAGLCRSAVIAFCDDLWEPRKLHACLAPFDDREALTESLSRRLGHSPGRDVVGAVRTPNGLSRRQLSTVDSYGFRHCFHPAFP